MSHPSKSDRPQSDNKRTIELLFDGCLSQGNLALLDELIAPEHVGPQGDRGPAGFRAVAGALRAGFPDIHYTLDDVIADGDRVAVRWHWTGTHTGQFRGFAPTGRSFTNPGIGIFQLRDGKIVASALETDRLGFLEQIGAVPPGVGGGPPRPAATAPAAAAR